jgi:hypothetical protein
MNKTSEDRIDFPELNDAWKNFGEKNFIGAIELAKQNCSSSIGGLNYEARKLTALSYFQLRQFDKSSPLFSELAKGSTNPDDHFNLATSATLNKDFDTGKKAFDIAVEQYKKTGTQENMSVPTMAFYYLHALKDVGAYEKAFEQLEFLGEVYKKLGITDSHFLYMRGVPFFEHTIGVAKDILKNISTTKARVWINKLKEHVDDEGKEIIQELQKELNE